MKAEPACHKKYNSLLKSAILLDAVVTQTIGTMGCTKVAERVAWQWKIKPGDFVIPGAIGRHPCLDDSVVIPCESMWVTNFIGRDVDGVETGL